MRSPGGAAWRQWTRRSKPVEVLVYDYIVIGTGSAGSVVAARLSEDPETRVLVLRGDRPTTFPRSPCRLPRRRCGAAR